MQEKIAESEPIWIGERINLPKVICFAFVDLSCEKIIFLVVLVLSTLFSQKNVGETARILVEFLEVAVTSIVYLKGLYPSGKKSVITVLEFEWARLDESNFAIFGGLCFILLTFLPFCITYQFVYLPNFLEVPLRGGDI